MDAAKAFSQNHSEELLGKAASLKFLDKLSKTYSISTVQILFQKEACYAPMSPLQV